MPDYNLETMPQAKLIKYGIYGTIAIVIIIFIIIGTKALLKKLNRDGVVNEAKKNINNGNLSFSDYKYEQIATAIYEAVTVWNGTDEDTIYRNLEQLNNKDDWYKLITVYGTDKDGLNLVAQLVDELGNSELKKVNVILSKFGESI